MTPNLMEAWLRLMAEAMRGSAGAQEAMQSLANLSTPDDFVRWMTRYMPAGTADAGRGGAEDWLEEWWRMIGLVPRRRYLDLLERHASLERKYAEAQAELRRLRSQQTPAQSVEQAVSAWESAVQDMLQAQARWVQAWSAATPQPADKPDEATSATSPTGKPDDQ